MIGYFDASALVKRYVEEANSDFVRRLVEECYVCTSRISEVEIASALVRRSREGSIAPAERDRALSRLREDMQSFYVIELFPEVARAARGLLLRYPLRASNAMQLASSIHVRDSTDAPVIFLAFDGKLNDAAEDQGLTLPPAG
ncbi:MAG TPA: type II toxin-antitoxin system VapC family toxin [Vicinamibacteria bacterium]|nr:type II toxin-antitoxin system VapC family toxin [Vicinamibacteria bacterium]